MSSKLVRKGLDLVDSEGSLRPKRPKGIQKAKQPSKKRKQRSSRANTEWQQPVALSTFSGHAQRKKQVDHMEENLQYFKRATGKIKKDTYDKILLRQNKLQKKNSEEKREDSDNKGGLFDD
ncbi:uncharacterized protein [Montipora capricornis]|uniref:uncharacterized protein n=1 Tax=Montipora capricornis TaxID=246305 RepID=UPI0035F145BA